MPSSYLIYLDIVVPVSVLIPIGIAFWNRRNLNRDIKVIWYYLILDGCTNILATVLAELNIRNLPVLHIFTIIEFLLLSYFYLLILKERVAIVIIKYLMVLFPVGCIINFIFFQSINHFNTNTRPVEALIIMSCSMAYFAQTNDTDTKWSLSPLNWINTGVLLYFSGALFIFSFSNVTAVHMSKKLMAINVLMWNIHATLVLIMYLLFAVGFSKCRKP